MLGINTNYEFLSNSAKAIIGEKQVAGKKRLRQ